MGGHVPNHQSQFFLFRIRVIPRGPACEYAERQFAN